MEEQAENARTTKQRYLKEQLQINGWSPEEFSDYLAEQKPDGLDINAWELDELIEHTRLFRQQRLKSLVVSRVIESGEDAPQESSLAGAEPSTRVEVLSEPRATSVLSLRVQPGNTQIKRTLGDLYALRARLQLEFPFSYVPPVRSATNQRAFAQNFFERLRDLRFASESETLKAFLDDARCAQQKAPPAERQLPQQMLERLFALLSEKSGSCQRNAAVYEEFLAECMPGFSTGKGSLEHFVPVARATEALCQSNAKLFSQLKHKLFELSASFERSAAIVEDIARLHAAHTADTALFGRRAGLRLPPRVESVSAKLLRALQGWARQLRTENVQAVERLSGLCHFRKHEYLTFAGLVLSASEAQEEFRRKWAELEERKRALFAAKNVEKWKLQRQMIGENLAEVTANYALVRPYMLPEETLALLRRFQFYLFLNKHVLYEFVTFLESSQAYTEGAFAAFAQEVRAGYLEGELWTAFSTGGKGRLSRHSTLLLQSVV